MPVVLNAVAQVSAERLLDSLVIGAALAVFAALLLRAVPRHNSAARFSIWFAALLGTLFLPLLELLPQASGGSLSPVPRALLSFPASWAFYLFLAWAIVAGLSVLRLLWGLLELRRMRRDTRPVLNPHPAWRQAVARFCPERPVRLLTSDRVHVPTAIGFFAPAVIIPQRLLAELSPAELHHVLLHELAHLRRWDDCTNVVQKFVKAVLFFHPAVWWIESRLSLEREMACDDAVLAETSSPRAYAQCLAVLAEKSLLRRGAALAQAAVHRLRQTTLRVARILDVDRPKAAPAGKSALAFAAAFACAFVALAWHTPPLVRFHDPQPPRPSISAAPAVTASLPEMPVLSPARLPAKTLPPPVNARRPAMQAKAAATKLTPRLRPQPAAVLAENHPRLPQVIPAKALQPPAVTTGVLVIVVDDPVLGPTPVLWRFTLWQVAAPKPAPHSAPATPQKSI